MLRIQYKYAVKDEELNEYAVKDEELNEQVQFSLLFNISISSRGVVESK